jgi:hypothetical protein
MKNLFFLASALLSFNLSAQKLYFPKPSYKDSLSFAESMPKLALQVLDKYKEAETRTRLNVLFRLQLLAGKYNQSISSIDSIRVFQRTADPEGSKAIGCQFEAFANAKLLQTKKHIPFREAYQTAFENAYLAMSVKTATEAPAYFDPDPHLLQTAVNRMLEGFSGRDSISLIEAKNLCTQYNSYTVYAQVKTISLQIIKKITKKNYIIEDSVLIPMKDGASISATIVRKVQNTDKLPVILIFNIYNGVGDISMAQGAANNGYVGVVANTRGKRLSPQDIEPFEHDANDAYEIIDWLSKQQWCNGSVGMYGGSYLGFSQWAAAKKVHPALKTIVPQVAVGIGIDYPMFNNVFMSYMLQWIHYVSNSKETDYADFGDQEHWDHTFKKWYSSGRAFNALDTIEGRPNKIFQRWLSHPDYDSYWQNMVACGSDFASIQIPILTTTGYFDDDQCGAMYYFNQHQAYNRHPEDYLLIGPYDHFAAQSSATKNLNGYTSVASLKYDFQLNTILFFDFL